MIMTPEQKTAVNKLMEDGSVCKVCRFEAFCHSLNFTYEDGQCTFDEPFNFDLDLNTAVVVANELGG